jgi:hypothetical protein
MLRASKLYSNGAVRSKLANTNNQRLAATIVKVIKQITLEMPIPLTFFDM